METALALESRSLALQVHQLLQDLDAARFQQEMTDALEARLQRIHKALSALLVRLAEEESMAAVRSRMAELHDVLAGWSMPDPATARARWMELKGSMQPVYEDLVDALRMEDVHVPRLRPTNYRRNAFHISSWLFALGVIGVTSAAWPMLVMAGTFALFAWTMEVGRRRSDALNAQLMKVFGSVAHPHETHRVNSATWYATALTILSVFQSVPMAVVAVTALGIGDPVAALIGRRWGRIRTLNGRSLEGSVAFVGSSFLCCMLALALLAPALTLGQSLASAAVGSVAGAVAETLCRRVDDNFGVPLAAGGASVLIALLLGVPL